MKKIIKKNVTKKKVLTLALVMLAMTPMLCTRRSNSHLQCRFRHQGLLGSHQTDFKSSRWTGRIYWRTSSVQQMDERRPRCQQRNPRAMAAR
jgi:hypothetical protein